MSKEVLSRHVRDALENLYDPVRLQIHPLLELLDVPRGPGQSAGEALRQLLWDTIESLRPSKSILPDRPEWLSYQILWLHYVQVVDRLAICQQLALSEASFYRRQRDGLDAVTGILHEQFGRDKSPDRALASGMGLAGGDQAREEAVKLARRSERQAVNLSALIEDVRMTIQPLLEGQMAALQVVAPDDLPDAYGDPAMLRQAVLNILVDALGLASGKQLNLDITITERESLWRLWSFGKAAGGDAEFLKHFSLSQGLLAVYGGRIWLDAEGLGHLALVFSIPVSKPRNILILDDDQDTVDLYRRYLQRQGYAVHVGSDASSLDAHLSEMTPDLVLLDVLMPKRDGWHVLQYLKMLPETMHVPVVVCSVLSQPRLALALGASEVLIKPIDRETLLRTVRGLLPEQDSQGEDHR